MKIAIFGDSWGTGAWSSVDGLFKNEEGMYYSDDYFTTKCMEYYETVDNRCLAGSCNEGNVRTLINYLKTSKDITGTKFLFIQTDPIRTYPLHDILKPNIVKQDTTASFFLDNPEYDQINHSPQA